MARGWGGGFIKIVQLLETFPLVALIEQSEEALSFVGTTWSLFPACFFFVINMISPTP